MPLKVTTAELQDVLDLIPNAQYGGHMVSASYVAHCLDLTLAQVYYRVRLLRERGVVMTVGDKVDRLPLLSFAGGAGGYILSSDPLAAAKHRDWRSKGALTIFRLTYKEAVTRFVATLPAAEQPAMLRKFERTWVRIIEDIGDAVVENNAVLATLSP